MKPILFNTEMVRAILEGRKTVTRRVVKFQLGRNPKWTGYVVDGLTLYNGRNEPCNVPAPYKVGDILYVRETWHKYTKRVGKGEQCHLQEFYGYKASIANSEDANEPWKPSIHMPKEAARIFLKVTDVRVERLHDMKLIDYLAEGISDPCDTCKRFPFDECDTCGREGTIGLRFAALWDSTIKAEHEHYCYTANPYVWVIEFERVEREEV